ncbi:MAG TPA: DUF2309 family protein, partial [Candidatus Melainabacteria bacterium]|nr:DUF2309 family protein [Candidatus Melainabacteria bacterium]
MPMRFNPLGSAMSLDLCPVLLKPNKQVKETADSPDSAQKYSWQALKVSAFQLKKRLKCNLAGTFGLVELLGLFSAIPLAMKTFMPSHFRKMSNSLELKLGGKTNTRLDLSAFSLAEKIALAEGAIKGIGLTNFGKLVVLCGHKSTSQNNPFASSLDCGACGGNGGGFSARLAAEILNDPCVRDGLARGGTTVPADTRFVAAEHDTTTDQVELLDCDALSPEHAEKVAQ